MFDGIHLLMNASYPLAVNASAGKIHKAGVDTPESVVVIAEYPEDFMAVFTINYAAMHYQAKNDQLSQLDGDAARLVGSISVKYLRDNPANSIILCEDWSGLPARSYALQSEPVQE